MVNGEYDEHGISKSWQRDQPRNSILPQSHANQARKGTEQNLDVGPDLTDMDNGLHPTVEAGPGLG